MKIEDQSPSPSNDEMLNQPQDPLERRRLQNRLSQRNHRRKIRERIAKLQERVIANELRAAAALHGWDQGYNTPYNALTFNSAPHSRLPEQEAGIYERDICTSALEHNATFIPHCTPYSTQPWGVDQNALQSAHSHTADASYLSSPGATSPNNPLTHASPSSAHASRSTNVSFGGGTFRDIANVGECQIQDSIPQSPNQPSYYVATEAALPQILEVINTMSPQSKVIVLVPPESSISNALAPFTTSNSSIEAGFDALGNGPLTLHSLPTFGCLCDPGNGQSGPSAESSSKTWNVSRGYPQACPLHKISPQNLWAGGFPTGMP
ncbi:hypothetical protein N7541_007172 [Penicillium brevicompactum]|uniref:BZIP domain-containing protein n=1 Tax=Penicillium brevicompactum TaxID=5074 RepID=A0A9W9QWU2_PENBR|nr:hypothetical protein N7541_007172 [Penicillium brevicompactum]